MKSIGLSFPFSLACIFRNEYAGEAPAYHPGALSTVLVMLSLQAFETIQETARVLFDIGLSFHSPFELGGIYIRMAREEWLRQAIISFGKRSKPQEDQ